MAIEIIELDDSRTGSEDVRNPGRSIHYIVRGTTDEQAVVSEVKSTRPGSLAGYVYNGFKFTKVGYDVWNVIVTYSHPGAAHTGQPSPPEVGEAKFSFTTKGATEHIDRAIDQVSGPFSAGDPTIDMNKAINFDGKTVQGLDVVIPKMTLNVEYTIPGAVLTPEYMGKVWYMTGRTNETAWKGFGVEELLFIGADGGIVYGEDTTLSFEFQAEESDPDKWGLPAQLAKPGWHFAWVIGEFSVSNGSPISKLRQGNIAQIYETGDFDVLGLPLPTTLIAPYTPPP